jgi:hypothetical protein
MSVRAGIRRQAAAIVLTLTAVACASTSETRTQNEFFLDVYWTASRQCETQHRNLRVERIATDGGLSVSAYADSSLENQRFRECYWTGVAARVERRRTAGLPVPADVNLHPDIDID